MDWFLYDNGLCHERVNVTEKNSEEKKRTLLPCKVIVFADIIGFINL